jgi:hypothetical protein
MHCVDAAFLTRNGILFTAVPLGLLKKCQEQRDELVNRGATSLTFAVNLTRENGEDYPFEASDILVRLCGC